MWFMTRLELAPLQAPGKGCKQPARSNRGLVKAAGLGLSLLCDAEIREAIRRKLEAGRQTARRQGRLRTDTGSLDRLTTLHDQRRKLLELHYADQISADQFGEERARLTLEIENLGAAAGQAVAELLQGDDLADKFEQVAALLDRLDVGRLWNAATEIERRTLLDEMLGQIAVHPDRLVVQVHGAPALNVTFSEVGLKAPDSEISHVGRTDVNPHGHNGNRPSDPRIRRCEATDEGGDDLIGQGGHAGCCS